ncbi:MAG: hypothetical protein KAU21_21315 [Gammaproteobacteria bacterium]|nr:hypothetical protein [Gammaproteobacteria bacterium]
MNFTALNRIMVLFVCLVGLLSAVSCGNKGPLTLPAEQPATSNNIE